MQCCSLVLSPGAFNTINASVVCRRKDGQLAGAFKKLDGSFQILPPGRSYQLHEKDYQPAEVRARTTKFHLGPYYFITVHNG